MAFTIPARLTTELDAVNMVLAAKNIAPVQTLEDNTDSSVEMAMLALNAADLEVQSKGWSFNSDWIMTLSPDAVTGEIALPDQTLSVNASYWASNGQWVSAVERASKLYDVLNQTFVWAQDVQVDLVQRLNFEDMPQVARNYIALLAAFRFQGKGQRSGLVTQITQTEVTQALAALEQHEDRAAPKNAITGNQSVLGRLWGGMRRNRS